MIGRIPRRRRIALAVVAAVYVAALAVVLFWPVHIDGDGGFVRFDPLLRALAAFGIPAWASYAFVEFAFNAALFVPLGMLVAAAASQRPVVQRIGAAVVGGLVVSCLAELVQHVFLPQRTTDARDVLANTLGAALGAVVVVAVGHLVRRRRASAIASAARTSARCENA
ncbi:VanZ family protein [Agromyces allii]|uniref:VanZ-like domain-containing protein n=1 Tax=Agromyces allii TaxID=393607 RepID=A0ABN2R1Y8_9MICO|nr:VanZ family protein [Agromyces allii]